MTPRWLLAIAFVTMTLGGCSGAVKEVRASAPSVPQASPVDPGAVFGAWAQGQDQLLLGGDGTYMWEREQICDLPPCPIDQTSGSFELEGSALRLATIAGPDLIIAFELASDPRRVTLRHPDGRSWTLRFVE